ncbi:hypothetical protein PanWU01x14_229850 [Parasponia andersonii]|uniref:Uncharacterized protein n=1 Tax=Parasponia andersonii TaxID=3476 RepID=A0A2P5BKY0_PARAD|nr:hypothetical protein PanWU01x14_229850 [Parasponia andersonii]
MGCLEEEVTFRSPWKAISSLYGEFFHRVKFQVGSGARKRFWEDLRVGDGTLKEAFPSFYRLSSFKNKPISEFYEDSSRNSSDSIGWKFSFYEEFE